jgi:hypothetical protein
MRNKDKKKDPWASLREDLKPIRKGGVPKKKWKSVEILLNSKLPNLILHLEFGTIEMTTNFLVFLIKKLLKIGFYLKIGKVWFLVPKL